VDLIDGKLSDLAVALARIAWRPLTPQLVAVALGISGQERARWTKDGRLPHSDQVHDCRGGRRLPIPTYTAALIEDLAVHRETLAAWRAQDAARGGDGRRWHLQHTAEAPTGTIARIRPSATSLRRSFSPH